MNCLIVDDEYLARTLLQNYLEKIPQVKLQASCENALQALEHLRQHPIDLMLLDIQMPDLTGLELLHTLPHKPLVILITAYADHALKGYELDVVDYLLKPVSFERFVQAINKAEDRWKLKQAASTAVTEQDHFYVKVDYKLVKIRFADILFIEGMREYVNIQTAERRHIVYQSMKNLEQLLSAHRFARCHKSYIVALDKIRSLYGNVLEIQDKEIPIGKSYKEAFMAKLEML